MAFGIGMLMFMMIPIITPLNSTIVNLLLSSKEPVSGSALAQKFNVSRQTVVQDVTVLKGTGYDILSTSQGYVIRKTPLVERVFKLKHTTEQTEDEFFE